MADENDTTTHAAPPDFAARALQTTQQPEGTPAIEQTPAVAPAKKEPAAEPSRKAPDELFGGKKEEPAKVTEAEPSSAIDKIADPVTSDRKVSENWKALKAAAKAEENRANESQAKAAELEKRIADAEAGGKRTAELEAKLATLEKENAEQMALVRKVNAELDPAYQQKRTERGNAVNDLKQLVKDSGGDPDALESALRLKGSEHIKAVADVIGDLPNYVQGIIGAKISEVAAIDRALDSARGNPEEYLQSRQREMQETEAKERAEFTRSAQLAYEHAEKKLTAELEVLRDTEGLPDFWVKQAREIKANARKDFELNSDPGRAAQICLEAHSMRVYRDLFLDMRGENAKLQAKVSDQDSQLKKVYGNSPNLRAPQSSTTDKGGFRDFATRTMDTATGA